MGLLRQFVKHAMTACLPAERWLTRGRTPQDSPLPAISLTFDDGPHPEHTPRVLEELSRWNLTATFFVIGQQAAAHPQLIEQIIHAGHTVANHTWTHSEPSRTSAVTFAEEVRQTAALLEALTSVSPRFVRPPKGELSLPKMMGLWGAGYTAVLWSVDPRDYRLETAEQVRTVSEQTRWQHGDIILLHDNQPGAAQLLRAWGEAGRWSQCHSVPLTTWLHPRTTAIPNRDPAHPAEPHLLPHGKARPASPTTVPTLESVS